LKCTRAQLFLLLGVSILCLLTACEPPDSRVQSSPILAGELVVYNWVNDMPQSVLDAFTREFGVKINAVTFESQEEAVENIRNGKVYDVAVIENPFVPGLIAANRLAEIDFRQVPNFKNISANFRDLATDPGNRYTVPYHYGTTGLLVRTDLIGNAVSRWADLWEPRYAGKIAIRSQPRELIAMTLLSLGYGLNSENPQELEAVGTRLDQLKKSALLVEVDTPKAVAKLLSGEAVVLLGWPMDYQAAHSANPAVTYVLPQEGTALWSDNYVIPVNSPNASTAMLFINFLLRPEISAQIVNERHYPNANEAAYAFVRPEIRSDPVLSPSAETLRRAHFFLPLSATGEVLDQRPWQRFLAATSPSRGDQ
jgi:spermidine/putrescine transport system substrate-binding protein